jgi:hypothetical protein
MTQYRIYAFRQDGHFLTVRRLECTDRDQAVQEAQQILDGQDGELWESEHLIARYPDVQQNTALGQLRPAKSNPTTRVMNDDETRHDIPNHPPTVGDNRASG